MLSISLIADAEYYLALSREDYYLQGGEPPGIWVGSAVASFQLDRIVSKESLRAMLSGFSPSGQPLIQNAGDPDHQPGWDLTFSAPKSVSIAWAVASEATRKQLQAAQFRAVKAAVKYLEEHAAHSRRGKGGIRREQAGLVVATFEHGTSRAQDPHLHTHCLFLNLVLRPDGSTGTLESHPLYVHKMAAGAVYRAALAHELTQLGFRLRDCGSHFEILGVPEKLISTFSKRREVIESALRSYGTHSAKAAEAATLATRTSKQHLPRSELLPIWEETAATHLFTERTVEALRSKPRGVQSEKTLTAIVAQALESLSHEQSYFARHELLRRVADAAAPHGFAVDRVEAAVQAALENDAEVVPLGTHDWEQRFTTQELFQKEASLLEKVRGLRELRRLEVDKDVLGQVLNRYESLSEEQRHAVTHLTTNPGAIHVVNGLPGTGKTSMLAACRQAWEESGFRVLGCALSAKAARELSDGSNIESHTIAKLVHLWDRTLLDAGKHTARQLIRAAQGKRTYQPEKIPLDARTILVVDEAGMVDTRQMLRIICEVERSGARLILVGDTRQLPAIGPGGAFKAMACDARSIEMTDMKRQKNTRDIEALRQLVEGDAQSALESFLLRDMLVLEDTKEQAIKSLVADWTRESLHCPQDAAIITATNREARIINALCQKERLKAMGQLNLLHIKLDDQRFFVGDRVLFLENSRFFNVLNGDLGTIISVNLVSRSLSVRLDSRNEDGGRIVSVTLDDYDRLQLGYARTTHKEQGTTNARSYVLLGGSMQYKELSFVQLSRHREAIRLYADRFEAGPDLQDLAWQMTWSASKELAHELVARQRDSGHPDFPEPPPEITSSRLDIEKPSLVQTRSAPLQEASLPTDRRDPSAAEIRHPMEPPEIQDPPGELTTGAPLHRRRPAHTTATGLRIAKADEASRLQKPSQSSAEFPITTDNRLKESRPESPGQACKSDPTTPSLAAKLAALAAKSQNQSNSAVPIRRITETEQEQTRDRV